MAQSRNIPTMRFAEKPITIDHHGFDPVNKSKATELVKGFKSLKTIDTSQDSFYITGGLLQDLTSHLRDGRRFDGFRFTFVIRQDKKITLVLTREYGIQDGRDEEYYKVPERFFQRTEDCNILSLITYGRILVNDAKGVSEGQFIDIEGADYQQMESNFKAVFCQNNSIPNLAMSTLKKLNVREAVLVRQPPKYAVVYSYFVGVEILRYLSRLSNGRGIKIFLGYGPSTFGTTSKNLHLLAIGTSDKDLEMARVSNNEEIWGTFDSTMQLTLFRMAQIDPGGDNTPILPQDPVPIDGSSTCIRPRPPYNPDGEE